MRHRQNRPQQPAPRADALATIPAAGAAIDRDSAAWRFAERGAEVLAEGTPPNTLRAYESDFRLFEAWCSSQQERFAALPTSEIALAGFLEAMFDGELGRRYRVGTIERRLSGIVRRHTEAGLPSPRTPLIARLLHSMKVTRARTGEAVGMAEPLTIANLHTIAEAMAADLDRGARPRARARRDKALLFLGWSCALRRSELAALRFEDVGRFVAEGTTIRIGRSKTDQTGVGVTMPLAPEGAAEVCPVLALRDWIDDRGDAPGALFWRIHNGRIQREQAMPEWQVADAFHLWKERSGLKPESKHMEYSAHSLRAGFITEAIRAGLPLTTVKDRSRHKTYDVFLRYVRIAQTFENNPQRGLLSRGKKP